MGQRRTARRLISFPRRPESQGPRCDAIGLIYEGLQDTGCTFVGSYAPEGYDVTDSLVCSDGRFVGLAIDESDPGKTDARLAAWCENLRNV